MEDQQIIALYWDRDQQAIAETADKYGGYLRSISWNILRSHDDADECVNDTYLRTWNAIPPARPSAFQIWLGRITRNLSLDRWKQQRAQKRGGEEREILLGELDTCVLPAESRVIFLRRYWYGEDLAAISKRMRCSLPKVKSSLFRTRARLRAYLESQEVQL